MIASEARSASESVERDGPPRLRAAAALIGALTLAGIGLAWDVEWHVYVGRDSFFSPPHLMLYSGVALSVVVCLTTVLRETWRYRQGQVEADDGSTVGVVGLLRAPLGFVLAGFGLLALVLSAPLDVYWHQLYGLDVTLWAPFHVMGLLGGSIAALGAVYAPAAEAARARGEARAARRRTVLGFGAAEWLALFALSGLARQLGVIARPGQTRYPTTELGPLEVLTYPPALTLVLVLVFVAAVRMTNRPGAACMVAALMLLVALLTAAFVPWAIRAAVEPSGLEYRLPNGPRFGLSQVVGMLVPFGPAILIDLTLGLASARLAARRANLLAGLVAALPTAYLGVLATERAARTLGSLAGALPPNIPIPKSPSAEAIVLGLLAAVPAALLAAWLGGGLGAVLRRNER